MRRAPLTAAVAVAAALVAVPAASASRGVKLAVAPKSPRAGAVAVVELRPYEFIPGRGNVPVLIDYTLVVQAVGPRRVKVEAKATRTSNPNVWRARLRFKSAGPWELRLTNWYTTREDARAAVRYPKGAPRLAVRVRPAG